MSEWAGRIRNGKTSNVKTPGTTDLNELSETRRVAVAGRLGVTEAFKNRVGVENDLLELLDARIGVLAEASEEAHDVLAGLGLAGTRLAYRAGGRQVQARKRVRGRRQAGQAGLETKKRNAPDTMMDWLMLLFFMLRYALSAEGRQRERERS